MRGEQQRCSGRAGSASGPSPRARGAAEAEGGLVQGVGTIPACAGSSGLAHALGPSFRDHPRVRGEQPAGGGAAGDGSGPSPRARGAVVRDDGRGDVRGTIPACAGSSRACRGRCTTGWDHPRVRGEQPGPGLHRRVVLGPSPRARGADLSQSQVEAVAGTIPACAGSSARPAAWRWIWRDHPRVRGEQRQGWLACWAVAGPSPRARGADHREEQEGVASGTIPACAGSSRAASESHEPTGDHPRVRGEQPVRKHDRAFTWGPSPRARGADSLPAVSISPGGTIPACAGSSVTRVFPVVPLWDHPRVRGEQLRPDRRVPGAQGPSPRARGAGGRAHDGVAEPGTIPACAGSRRCWGC